MKKIRFVFFSFSMVAILLFGSSRSIADPNVQWQFKSLGEDANGTPSTILSVLVNDNLNEIATETGNFYIINPEDFKDNGIPKNALIACQCWWAGAGADYWVVKKGSTLVVMERDLSEGDPDHPYDYTSKPVKVKTIKLD